MYPFVHNYEPALIFGYSAGDINSRTQYSRRERRCYPVAFINTLICPDRSLYAQSQTNRRKNTVQSHGCRSAKPYYNKNSTCANVSCCLLLDYVPGRLNILTKLPAVFSAVVNRSLFRALIVPVGFWRYILYRLRHRKIPA